MDDDRRADDQADVVADGEPPGVEAQVSKDVEQGPPLPIPMDELAALKKTAEKLFADTRFDIPKMLDDANAALGRLATCQDEDDDTGKPDNKPIIKLIGTANTTKAALGAATLLVENLRGVFAPRSRAISDGTLDEAGGEVTPPAPAPPSVVSAEARSGDPHQGDQPDQSGEVTS